MPSYVSKPTPPNQDKRWKLVDATMRRQGLQARGLIDTRKTEGLLSLDPQLVCYSWITGIADVAQIVFVRNAWSRFSI